MNILDTPLTRGQAASLAAVVRPMRNVAESDVTDVQVRGDATGDWTVLIAYRAKHEWVRTPGALLRLTGYNGRKGPSLFHPYNHQLARTWLEWFTVEDAEAVASALLEMREQGLNELADVHVERKKFEDRATVHASYGSVKEILFSWQSIINRVVV